MGKRVQVDRTFDGFFISVNIGKYRAVFIKLFHLNTKQLDSVYEYAIGP